VKLNRFGIVKMKRLMVLFLVTGIAFHSNTDIFAATGISNARALGLAGAYLSLARGAEAPNWNPANLGLDQDPGFSMNFLSTGIGIHNNSFSKNQYDQYNGQYINNEEKRKLLNCISDDGLVIDLDTEVQILGFAYRQFALTATGMAESNLTIAKDLVELGLLGNAHKSRFDFGDTDGAAWAFNSYAFSAAFPIKLDPLERFAAGFNLKLIHGLFCFDVVKAGGALSTDIKVYGEGETIVQYARGGLGLSLDLGAASMVNDRWHIGLTFNNILNTINWNREAKRNVVLAKTDSLDLQTVMDVEDVDSLFYDEDHTDDINSFSTTLPQEMRVGATYSARTYLITMDYIQGFRRGPGVTTTPRLACGIEYKPLFWLPLRTGFAIGGRETFILAIGLGFKMGRVRLDLAATNQGSILPGSRHGSTLAFGIRLLP